MAARSIVIKGASPQRGATGAFSAGASSTLRYNALTLPAGVVPVFSPAAGPPPGEGGVFGDNRHDMEMGHNAGCGACIGVLTGTSAAQDLAPLATVVLDSIAALEAGLDSN